MKKIILIFALCLSALFAIGQTSQPKATGITGSGTAGYLPKFSAAKTITNSIVYQSGTGLAIGTTSTNLGRFVIKPNTGEDAIYILANTSQDASIKFNVNTVDAFKIWCNTSTRDGNIWTNNNNTVFWTGTAGAMVRNLELDYRGFATFTGNVGIGITGVTSPKLQVQTASFGSEHFRLAGADFYGAASSNSGLSMLLGVNTGSNRQLWLADSDALTVNGTNSVLAFKLGGTDVPQINALSTNALVYKDLAIQANGGKLGIGTITPGKTLDVVGDIKFSGTINTGTLVGVSGSYTTVDSKTVTVTNGIITAITP